MQYFRNYQAIPGANDTLKNAISEDTYSIIYAQELMQTIQLLAWFVFFFLPFLPNSEET